MPTPEELQAQVEKQNAELAELRAKAGKSDALEIQLKTLADDQAKLKADNQKKDLDIARRDAFAEFPLARDFGDMVTGGTPDEVKARAKAIHEKQAEVLKARGAKVEDPIDQWKGVPGSVPAELLIANDRETQYQKVRESALPKRHKIGLMMGMHIEDLFKKHYLDVRKKIGLR